MTNFFLKIVKQRLKNSHLKYILYLPLYEVNGSKVKNLQKLKQ